MSRRGYGVPRAYQGQTVERSYLCLDGAIIRRTLDRSDGEVRLEKAEINDDEWSWYASYEPSAADYEPPVSEPRWHVITAAEANALEEG